MTLVCGSMATFYLDTNKVESAGECGKNAAGIIRTSHEVNVFQMAQLHMIAGRVHARQGQFHPALEHFENSKDQLKVQLDSENLDNAIMATRGTAMSDFYIASVLERKGEFGDAVEKYQRALDMFCRRISIEDHELRMVADTLVNVQRR